MFKMHAPDFRSLIEPLSIYQKVKALAVSKLSIEDGTVLRRKVASGEKEDCSSKSK